MHLIFVRLNFKNLIDVLLHRKPEDADYQLYELKTSNRLKFPDLWGTNEMFRFCKNSFTLVFLLKVLLFYSVRLFVPVFSSFISHVVCVIPAGGSKLIRYLFGTLYLLSISPKRKQNIANENQQ